MNQIIFSMTISTQAFSFSFNTPGSYRLMPFTAWLYLPRPFDIEAVEHFLRKMSAHLELYLIENKR